MHEDRCYIWKQLARAKAFDVGQVITACEIAEMKDIFLSEWYENRVRGDIRKNECDIDHYGTVYRIDLRAD